MSIVTEEAERLLAIDSSIEEDDHDDDDDDSQTMVDAAEEALVRNAARSAGTKTDVENGI